MNTKSTPKLTVFEKSVLACLRRIPAGRVTTYKRLAQMVGRPAAVRAVGNALHKNPNAPTVPCHRVVRSDGALGGYAFGVTKKEKLLRKEGIPISNNRVVKLKQYIV